MNNKKQSEEIMTSSSDDDDTESSYSSCESSSDDDDDEHCHDDESRLCSCILSDVDSDTSDTEDFKKSKSEDEFGNFNEDKNTGDAQKKICFIYGYDKKNEHHTFFICYFEEIVKYRNNSNKNTKRRNIYWGEVKIYAQSFGHIPLKLYEDNLKSSIQKKNVSNNNQQQNKNHDLKINNVNQTVEEKLTKDETMKKENKIVEIITEPPQENNVEKNKSPEDKIKSNNEKTESENFIYTKVNECQLRIDKLIETSKKLSINNEKLNSNESNVIIETSLEEVKKDSKHNNVKMLSSETKSLEKIKSTDNNIELKVNSNSQDKLSAKKIDNTSTSVLNNNNNNNKKNKTIEIDKLNKKIKNKSEELISNEVKKKKDKSTDNKTPNLKISKIVKPVLSKKKQKKKHLNNKNKKEQKNKTESSNNLDMSQNNSSNKMEKKFLNVKKVTKKEIQENERSDEMSNEDKDIDQMLQDQKNIPAFYVELFKRKEKLLKKKNVNNNNSPSPPSAPIIENDEGSDSSDDFVTKPKKRMKNVVSKVDDEESEKLGELGIEMIMQNKLSKAINYFTKALSVNPTDYRHFLNRCYAYLRNQKYSNALADAQIVIQNSKNLGFSFIANLRAGQAANYLKKYQLAESYLKEALEIYPVSPHAERELFRVQIARIKEKNYSEKQAVHALKQCSSTAEAIHFLNETYVPKDDDDEYNLDELIFDDKFDDQIYDESDKKNSVAEALNLLMKCNPEELQLRHVAQSLISWLRPSNFSEKSQNVGKNLQFTENAVWVGSLTDETTEAALKKTFRHFGNIISIHRPEGKAFCFINYEKPQDAINLLKSTKTVNVNGCTTVLRPAVKKD